MVHQLAGKLAPKTLLANIPRLISSYYIYKPDISDPTQQVTFGTSGHRGSSLKKSFNEDHVIAIAQAIYEYRESKNITGPLFMGMDTHALSEPAIASALEVFAANGVQVLISKGFNYTPTPAVSHAILKYNREKKQGLADGVIITPSHNPPEDGGLKYNPPSGGPADTEITKIIENRANEILREGLKKVKRIPFEKALKSGTTHEYDYIIPYVDDLKNIIDMEIIAKEGFKIGVDPLGGSSVKFFDSIAEKYKISIEVVNQTIDPTFSFMTVDKDGRIRMDCSSPYAMEGLIHLKDKFNIAFGNDPDCDRHGIVTPSAGLLNPNHFFSVAVWYIIQNRPQWSENIIIGKTLVSSSMIDRVAAHLHRRVAELPVGFKWFVDGLIKGSYAFSCEESAGASFLRRDGTVWTTDKDGFIMGLLACEITAKTGKDPGEIYKELEEKLGKSIYERIDIPATPEQKAAIERLSPEMIRAKELGGEPITGKITRAPGNNASIGGLKVVSENGWFAARPSGTENIIKVYLESFKGEAHFEKIKGDVMNIIQGALL